MRDMFLILKAVYLTSYFVVADNIEDVIRSLTEVSENLITCFSNNLLKLNPDKWCLLLNTKEQATLKMSNLHIKNSLCQKLLGINFDYKINLAKHTEDIRQKSIKKVKCNCKIDTIYDVMKNIF